MTLRTAATSDEQIGRNRAIEFSLANIDRLIDPKEETLHTGPPSLPNEASSSDVARRDWREHETDVWGETELHPTQFLKTAIYEFLPILCAYPLCFLLDGRMAAFNRFCFGGNKGSIPIVELLLGSGPFWILLLLYHFLSTEEKEHVHWIDIATLGLVKFYRACCIGMKYAYFSRSELACINGSEGYGNFEKAPRRLGGAVYYDAQGSFEWDLMEHIFESILRNSLVGEFPAAEFTARASGKISLDPVEEARWDGLRRRFFAVTREKLAVLDDPNIYQRKANKTLKHEHIWHSKYGNVRKLLSLDHASLTQAEEQGRLPLSIVAYSVLALVYKPSKVSPKLFLTALVGCAIVPVARAFQFGSPAFAFAGSANSFLPILIYSLRCFYYTLSLLGMFFFGTFPFLDAYKRWKLAQALLVLFLDDPEAKNVLRTHSPELADAIAQLNPDGVDLVRSPEDLSAAWAMLKIASPTFLRNMISRYNNGYSSVNLVYLSSATAMLFLQLKNDPYWPFVFEQCFVFIILGVFVCMTVFYGVWCQETLVRMELIFLRANVRRGQEESKKTESGSSSYSLFQALSQDLGTELKLHHQFHSMQFMYKPASAQLVNFVYGYVSFLSSAIFSALIVYGHVKMPG